MNKFGRFPATSLLALLLVSGSAWASSPLPTGGGFAQGTGSIGTLGNTETVTQTSPRGVVDWTTFSISNGYNVQINNGGGATLNRVTGGLSSNIAGHLSSDGTVYLINPSGIIVSSTGQVLTTGTFIASTRDESDTAFMNADTPEFTGSSSGTVGNSGQITSTNGDVILIGQGNLTNDGKINAANGMAGMAAGNDVLVQAPGSSKRILISVGGGNITNTGTLAGAQAELNAASGNIYALAGNNGGLVKATGTSTINGIVYLTAASVTVSGTVAAYTKNGSTSKIVVNAPRITIMRGGKMMGSVTQSSH
jgi:filamentous hemagglutinin family protein